jgi:hypothetical protein
VTFDERIQNDLREHLKEAISDRDFLEEENTRLFNLLTSLHVLAGNVADLDFVDLDTQQFFIIQDRARALYQQVREFLELN